MNLFFLNNTCLFFFILFAPTFIFSHLSVPFLFLVSSFSHFPKGAGTIDDDDEGCWLRKQSKGSGGDLEENLRIKN